MTNLGKFSVVQHRHPQTVRLEDVPRRLLWLVPNKCFKGLTGGWTAVVQW
jgi:hypothetical protein